MDKVSAVEMSPTGGTFADYVWVSLSCATSGAKIYYTTDGSEPDESSTAYSDPFKVTSSLTVKARAYLDGMGPSDVSSAAYSIVYGRWQTVGSADFSEVELENISLALYQDTPYIAYVPTDSTNVSVMKYNGTDWEDFGDDISLLCGAGLKLIFDSDGTMFLAGIRSGDAYVKKKGINASEWETLGDMETDFPQYTVNDYSNGRFGFAVHNGIPYLACQNWEGENTGTGCVVRFNGTNWVNVGQPDFNGDKRAYQMDIAFDNNGVPSVCFFESTESAGSGIADFMTLNDSNNTWERISDDFSDCAITEPDLVFEASGTPYVVFEDVDNSNRAVVMKYTGSDWTVIGNSGFSRGQALWPSLAFKGDVPYVCFSSYLDDVFADDTFRIKVMMFDGQDWLYAGKEIILDEICLRPSIAVDSSGAVYIAFIWGGNRQVCVMKYAP